MVALTTSTGGGVLLVGVAGKVTTMDTLRRGMMLDSILDICVWCKRKQGSINHLFLNCEASSFV